MIADEEALIVVSVVNMPFINPPKGGTFFRWVTFARGHQFVESRCPSFCQLAANGNLRTSTFWELAGANLSELQMFRPTHQAWGACGSIMK